MSYSEKLSKLARLLEAPSNGLFLKVDAAGNPVVVAQDNTIANAAANAASAAQITANSAVSSINTEANTRAAADTAETTARIAGDNSILTNLATETAARIAGDSQQVSFDTLFNTGALSVAACVNANMTNTTGKVLHIDCILSPVANDGITYSAVAYVNSIGVARGYVAAYAGNPNDYTHLSFMVPIGAIFKIAGSTMNIMPTCQY